MSTTLTIDTPDEQEAMRGCLYGFAKRLPDEPIAITDPTLTLQAARDMDTYARLCKAHADRSITPHLVPDVLEGLRAALDDVAANYTAANSSDGAIGAIDAANWKADRRRLLALREKVHAFANSAFSPPPVTGGWANLSPDECVWATSGWENASLGSVQDATDVTRGQAAGRFARECGEHITDIRVWTRYLRMWDLQDAWDDYAFGGDDRWECSRMADEARQAQGLPDGADVEAPKTPPAGWEPPEGTPCWEFVHRTHPQAIRVWICGFTDDTPPHNPKAPAAAQETAYTITTTTPPAQAPPEQFSYSPWRHGGWYVDNVRHPNGGCGCVSRNFPDKKWRIVCDPRDGNHTYPDRDAAARAEWTLTQTAVTVVEAATLQEARTAAADACSEHHDPGYHGSDHSDAEHLPATGGTIGPLPDGTTITVTPQDPTGGENDG